MRACVHRERLAGLKRSSAAISMVAVREIQSEQVCLHSGGSCCYCALVVPFCHANSCRSGL